MVGVILIKWLNHPAVSLGGRTEKRRRIRVIGDRCGRAEEVPWVPPFPRSSVEVGPRFELRVGRSNDPQSSVPLPQSECRCCTGTGIDGGRHPRAAGRGRRARWLLVTCGKRLKTLFNEWVPGYSHRANHRTPLRTVGVYHSDSAFLNLSV